MGKGGASFQRLRSPQCRVGNLRVGGDDVCACGFPQTKIKSDLRWLRPDQVALTLLLHLIHRPDLIHLEREPFRESVISAALGAQGMLVYATVTGAIGVSFALSTLIAEIACRRHH